MVNLAAGSVTVLLAARAMGMIMGNVSHQLMLTMKIKPRPEIRTMRILIPSSPVHVVGYSGRPSKLR